MISSLLISTLFLTFLYFLWDRRRRSSRNFPPGPLSFPIIGGLYTLGLDPFKGSIGLWKKYGPLVGIDIASFRSVFINDDKLAKIALNNPALQARPNVILLRPKCKAKNGIVAGIISADGPTYVETRNLTLKTLKEFGFGSTRLENIILDQVDKIFKSFDVKAEGKMEIESENLFNPYIASVVWTFMLARKMPNEAQIKEAIDAFDAIIEGTMKVGNFAFFPAIWKIAPRLTGLTQYESDYTRLFKLCHEFLESHKQDRTTVESDKDFVDVILEHIERTTDTNSAFYGQFGEFNLKTVMVDFILGGVDTASEVMIWALVVLINYPKIQEKLHRVIDEVTGGSEMTIKLEHRSKLPYVEGFIKEVLRFRPVFPWSAPHLATEDTRIGTYDVPKGTLVFTNLFAIGQDPRVFPSPKEIKPERFLSDDEKEVVSVGALTPFSTGKRICPGMNLAQDEMFLILANIFQRYEINGVEGQGLPSLDYKVSFLLAPRPFKFMLRRRNK